MTSNAPTLDDALHAVTAATDARAEARAAYVATIIAARRAGATHAAIAKAARGISRISVRETLVRHTGQP